MNSLPKILLVEDDDFQAEITAEMLTPDYSVLRATTGQAALDSLAAQIPDLVLLDVRMPGMSGYDVCRALREHPAVGDLPVVFLSALVSKKERLAGYEAGGDDYLTKPVAAQELRAKIKLLLASYAERIALRQDMSNAFSTAMTAMSSVAEIGAILRFMRASFSCLDYASLCREVLETLGSYGLEASVKIHAQHGEISLNPKGTCSPLEDSVLDNMRSQGHLFDFGSRTSFSYERVTLIVKRDENCDSERYGRIKDNIALLAQGSDARIAAMDNAAAVQRQHEKLTLLTENTRKALQEIEHSHRLQGIKSNQIFQTLQKKFDDSMIFLGITVSHEEELANMILEAGQKARGLYDEGLKISSNMKNILIQLESRD